MELQLHTVVPEMAPWPHYWSGHLLYDLFAMDVTLALLADSANVSQEGKLNILGSFNNVNSAVFPCVHPQMVLVMRFEASRAEIGQSKQLEIRLMDPDGSTLGSVTGSFDVPDAPPGDEPPPPHATKEPAINATIAD